MLRGDVLCKYKLHMYCAGTEPGRWQASACICSRSRHPAQVCMRTPTLLFAASTSLCCRLLKIKVRLQTAGSACSNKQCDSGLQRGRARLAGLLVVCIPAHFYTVAFAAAFNMFCSQRLPVAAALFAGPHAQVISLRAYPPSGRCCYPATLPAGTHANSGRAAAGRGAACLHGAISGALPQGVAGPGLSGCAAMCAAMADGSGGSEHAWRPKLCTRLSACMHLPSHLQGDCLPLVQLIRHHAW